jgi:hypothetical protein
LGRSQAFWRFAWHIFADLPRFQEVYNNALRDYRKANGLKSENHPAPELKQKKQPDIWFESPFWGLNSSKLSRGRVWARVEDDYLDLWSEGVGIVKCLLYPGAPNEELADCCNCRIKLRPRALTLTLFARVCLGDFFIHGIGGGKYDEVTDAIIRDYFGIDPPAYQVLSATLHLPLPAFSSTDVDVKRLEHELRDLTWNPQRHLTAEALARPEVQRLVKEKRVLAAHEPPRGDHDARRDWFRRLQHVTEQLRPLVAEQVSKADANVRRARTEAHANAILQRRDYSWVLYPEETLRPFLQQFLSL